jgi:hypothetical protein
MKFNLLGKISIIIVSLALLAGCGFIECLFEEQWLFVGFESNHYS